MSSTSFTVTAEEMSSLITTLSCENVAFTILVYDWLLCLDQEIALIWNWKTRRTVAPLLYILARYMPIVLSTFISASIPPMSLFSCEAVFWVQVISGALSHFAPAVFSAMRTYALTGTVYLAIVPFILSTAPIITNLVENFKFTSIHVLPIPFNCSSVDQTPQRLGYNLTMITRACLISADIYVIVITWMYTYKSYKVQKSFRLGSSLTGILLYNGSIYFMVLASLNILDMAIRALQIESVFIATGSYVVLFSDPISYILISRFVLNLRQVDHNTIDPSLPSDHDGNMSIQFATRGTVSLPEFIGPFGETVRTGPAVDPGLDFKGESPDLLRNASPEPGEPDGEIIEVSRI